MFLCFFVQFFLLGEDCMWNTILTTFLFFFETKAEAGWIIGWSSDQFWQKEKVGFLVLKVGEMKMIAATPLLNNPPPGRDGRSQGLGAQNQKPPIP